MELTVKVSSIEDVKIAHAVLDSFNELLKPLPPSSFSQVNEKVRQFVESQEPVLVADRGSETEEEKANGADPSPDESSEGVYSKEQVKLAAKSDPELLKLISGRGKRSAATKAEIQRRTAAVLNGGEPSAPPVGSALAGASAEELNEAIKQVAPTELHSSPEVEVRSMEPLNPDAEATPVEEPYSGLSKDELVELAQKRAEEGGEAGFRWYCNVINAVGGFKQVTVEHLRDALENPAKYS